MYRIMKAALLVACLLTVAATSKQKDGKQKPETKETKIARALSAGPANIARATKVVDRDEKGNETVLREGTNGFTCFPGHLGVVIAYCASDHSSA